MPLLLRKERGNLQLAQLKVAEAKLEFLTQQAAFVYKAKASINEWETTVKQLNLYTQTVSDYNRLLKGERRMFNAGESSLFMVNSREYGYIKAQLKFIELLTKNHKASLTASYTFGLLLEN